MELGQFVAIAAGGIAGLVALIKGLEYLWEKASAAATKWLQSSMAPTNAKIDQLNIKIDAVDRKVVRSEYEADKTILVRLIADIKNGNKLTDVELERFHETYGHYTSPEIGGNSYVKTEVEKLKNEGKI